MRSTIGKLFGYLWTSGRSGRSLAAGLLAAVLFAGLGAGLGARVWPIANDPAFDPPSSPLVRRVDDRLIFEPAATYFGGPAGGGRNGAYQSFLKISPVGPPVAENANCLGLSPEGVLLLGFDKVEHRFTPFQYERAQRTAIGLMFLVVFLAPLPLFFVAARLLLAARFGRRPRPSALRIVARAFIPALCFAGLAAFVFPVNQPPWVAFGALFGAAGANLLFGVADGAIVAARSSP